MSNLWCSSISIISKTIYHNSNSTWTITFIYDFFKIIIIISAASFCNCSVNIIIRHIFSLRFINCNFKRRIIIWIKSTFLSSHSYLSCKFSKNFTFFCIFFTFFIFNIIPFRMSWHLITFLYKSLFLAYLLLYYKSL